VLVWKDDTQIGTSACAPDRSLEGHTEDILSIAFMQPNLLATCGYDGVVRGADETKAL
jgi:WD40 repeat protein